MPRRLFLVGGSAFLESLDIALSSDFIAGFCGETEDEHRETLSLVEQVGYAYGFCFPFSLRAVSLVLG